MSDVREAVLGLRLIATLAEKLATDLDRGRLWEGDYQQQVAQINRAVRELPEMRGR